MGKPLRALIVEDNEDDADLVRLELKRGGYDVTQARVETADGLDGALQEGPWDVILSDYMMPTLDGRKALEIVRRRGIDTPFIIVSGTIGEETAVEAMRAGANDYLLKGNLTRLCPAVERELREAASRRKRTQAEQSLERTEEYNRALLEAIPDMIFRVGRDGTYLDFVAGEMAGRTCPTKPG